MFIYLLNLGSSISSIESLVESQGLKAVIIGSANNYVDFLHLYFQ